MTEQLKNLMKMLDPQEVFFIIGHKLSGYEKYLIDHNDKEFQIFAMIPKIITKKEVEKLNAAKVNIRVSTETEGMGIYKSFNYEIFERRPSLVIAFDGNSAGANLIQEAKNAEKAADRNVQKSSEKKAAETIPGFEIEADTIYDSEKIVKFAPKGMAYM